MMRGKPGKPISPSTRLTIFGGLLLCFYIIFILLFYYRNNTALQESSLNRFRLDVENKAASIEYFFLERRYDIRTLADSQAVQIYFTNLDMGMSEEYGLVVSLFSIQQLMRKTIADKTINGQPVYTKIAFLNADKHILTTSSDLLSARPTTHQPEWKNLLTGIDREPSNIVSFCKQTQRYAILTIAPCRFKGKLVGWIIGRINPRTLYQQFIASPHALSSKIFLLTWENGKPIHLLDDRKDVTSCTLPIDSLTDTGTSVIKTVSTPECGGDTILVTRCPIDPLNIFLTACVREDEILGSIKTWHVVLGAAAMIFLIVAILAWSIRANVRHIILRTRFEEAKKQQEMLAQKNRQLEEEIRRRQRAEEHLRENEQRYRKLFEFSNDAILILEDDTVIACNQETARLLHMQQQDILGKTFSSFSPAVQPRTDLILPPNARNGSKRRLSCRSTLNGNSAPPMEPCSTPKLPCLPSASPPRSSSRS